MKPSTPNPPAGLPPQHPSAEAVPSPAPEQLKAAALRMSAASQNATVVDVRSAFGFFPPNLQGVVIHWPPL